MHIHGESPTEEFPVHGQLFINTSDLPASRKLTGLRIVTTEDFMCTFCYQNFTSLVCEDCFNRESKSFFLFNSNEVSLSRFFHHRIHHAR